MDPCGRRLRTQGHVPIDCDTHAWALGGRERGLPLVRAANTGISAVVDPLGRATAWLGLGETGALDAVLPAALAAGTPYNRYGEGIVLTMAMLIAAASVFVRRINGTSRKFGKG